MTDRKKKPDQRDATFVIPDRISVRLKKPVKKGDETLAELNFRPPTVGEMKLIAAREKKHGEAEAGIFLLSLLNEEELAPPEIEQMNFIDMQICTEHLEPFLHLRPRSEDGKD